MRKIRRITTCVLVVSLLVGNCDIPTVAETTKGAECKEYVVMAEYDNEEILDEFVEDNKLYKEKLDIEDSYGLKVKATKQ